MSILHQYIPRFILTKRNQTFMVTFVAIFAYIFIIIYKPFGALNWGEGEVSEVMFGIYSLLIVLLGMAIVTLSRMVMYYHTKQHGITYIQYILWVLAELILMSCAYAVCAICTHVQSDTYVAFRSALINTSLILLIPYILSITFFALQYKNQRIREITDDFDNAVALQASTKGLIPFYDERGELQLSVAKENLLYIESADNYVCIWYLKNEQIKKLMLRNTMKRVAEQLSDTPIMRCHRSFMVNMEQVKVIRREKENFFLELGINGVMDIPVSKTYGDAVMKWLSI